MPIRLPEYPEILTQASWDKKKGVFAKLFGKPTGIGEAMKELKTAFDAVKWAKFELWKLLPTTGATIELLDQLKHDALSEASKLKTLDTKARDLEKLAQKIAADFKKNKLIPSSATEHVGKVEQAAKALDYAISMGTLSDLLEKEYQENKKGIETNLQVLAAGRQRFVGYVDKVIAGLGKTYTMDEFNTFWKEDLRGVGTGLPEAVKSIPDLGSEYAAWKQTITVGTFQATAQDTPETIAKKLTIIKVIILRIKDKLNKAG
jgi:hypothetical protein